MWLFCLHSYCLKEQLCAGEGGAALCPCQEVGRPIAHQELFYCSVVACESSAIVLPKIWVQISSPFPCQHKLSQYWLALIKPSSNNISFGLTKPNSKWLRNMWYISISLRIQLHRGMKESVKYNRPQNPIILAISQKLTKVLLTLKKYFSTNKQNQSQNKKPNPNKKPLKSNNPRPICPCIISMFFTS